MTASSLLSRKNLGSGFPFYRASCVEDEHILYYKQTALCTWGTGVTDPTSTSPNPRFNIASTASPCLSYPAAKPIGLEISLPHILDWLRSMYRVSHLPFYRDRTLRASREGSGLVSLGDRDQEARNIDNL